MTHAMDGHDVGFSQENFSFTLNSLPFGPKPAVAVRNKKLALHASPSSLASAYRHLGGPYCADLHVHRPPTNVLAVLSQVKPTKHIRLV